VEGQPLPARPRRRPATAGHASRPAHGPRRAPRAHQGHRRTARGSWAGAHRRSIDELLARARARLERLDAPTAARLLAAHRIVLVDTRPQHQRDADGIIQGALIIDRNVLEWRLDPTSRSRLPIARYDLPVVVICAQGYSSSLTAAGLLDLGLTRATDVVGGFAAWRRAGLPIG
jgi:rhodanese-related sulfurtransferase